MPKDRLYTAFHEKLALNLPSIAAILRLSAETQGNIGPSQIRTRTTLGNNYVKAMPCYARGSGLLDMSGYQLTPFGRVTFEHDPNLSCASTLWAMHYHLSTPHGPGPAFWSKLICTDLPFGEQIGESEIVAKTTSFLQRYQSKGVPNQDTITHAIRALRRTYVRSDGLGRLALLEESKDREGISVSVSGPKSPPLGAVAYALADYWEAHYGDQATVSLSELARQDGFARVMWMDSRRFEAALEELRREGLVDLFRIAPPFQIARLWSDKSDLLEQLYR